MNKSSLNRFEWYSLDKNWNRSNSSPICASDVLTVESIVPLIKFNYGQPINDGRGTIELADNWADTHFDFITTAWISNRKLTEQYRFELGITMTQDVADQQPIVQNNPNPILEASNQEVAANESDPSSSSSFSLSEDNDSSQRKPRGRKRKST